MIRYPAIRPVPQCARAPFAGVAPAMVRLSAMLMLLVSFMTGAASAATLASRPSTALFSGVAAYEIDLAGGSGFAIGSTSDGGFDFFVSGFFDPGTQGDNPVDVDLTLSDFSTFDVAVNARGLEEVEIGGGFVALLFGDLMGASVGSFTGGKLLAILSDPSFPALNGNATFELRRLGVIPLPATAPLLVGGLALLGLARRKRGQ